MIRIRYNGSMVDDNCFEEISCEDLYGDLDTSQLSKQLISCHNAQVTAKVLYEYHNTRAMRSLMSELIDSLNLCEELLRSKISQKDGK